ncbi:hypothetical protein ACN4EK_09905 [Pantanalinema rosaneae CENA516]|uniref:hypothetical protein n=1 Tax=Pantanalinema rosaneae TaxID=1620701 RepID=UPI003D6FF1D4
MSAERLDRIERILEAVVVSNQGSSERLDRIEAIVGSNTRSIERLTADVEGLALQMEQMMRSAEQDRSQAALDRTEFRTTVQAILDAWTQRCGGNGHTREE